MACYSLPINKVGGQETRSVVIVIDKRGIETCSEMRNRKVGLVSDAAAYHKHLLVAFAFRFFKY